MILAGWISSRDKKEILLVNKEEQSVLVRHLRVILQYNVNASSLLKCSFYFYMVFDVRKSNLKFFAFYIASMVVELKRFTLITKLEGTFCFD